MSLFYIKLHYNLVLNSKRNKYQSIKSTDMRNHDFGLSHQNYLHDEIKNNILNLIVTVKIIHAETYYT